MYQLNYKIISQKHGTISLFLRKISTMTVHGKAVELSKWKDPQRIAEALAKPEINEQKIARILSKDVFTNAKLAHILSSNVFDNKTRAEILKAGFNAADISHILNNKVFDNKTRTELLLLLKTSK